MWKAQGKGCSPGAVGVCIGGDRTSGYLHAKEQLFRTLDDVNPDPRLAELEASIMDEANKLDVGPMGFGGKTSLIGCKIGALNRLPASFFVSVAYDCWAFRRLGVDARRDDRRDHVVAVSRRHAVAADAVARCSIRPASRGPAARSRCSAPLTDEQVRALKVGDVVLISGRDVHRPRRGARAPDEARAAGRSARRRCSITAVRSW